MINGIVTNTLEAVVALTIHGPLGDSNTELFVMDTGFNGDLTLSSKIIGDLSLLYLCTDTVTLADGSQTQIPLYQAVIDWDGQQRNVLVFEAEGSFLLGTNLLFNHDVFTRFVPGGVVQIQRSP